MSDTAFHSDAAKPKLVSGGTICLISAVAVLSLLAAAGITYFS